MNLRHIQAMERSKEKIRRLLTSLEDTPTWTAWWESQEGNGGQVVDDGFHNIGLTRFWRECQLPEWIFWVAERLPEIFSDSDLILAACDCARTTLQYVPDGEHRPRLAIEAAEAYALDPTEQNYSRLYAARNQALFLMTESTNNEIWAVGWAANAAARAASIDTAAGAVDAAANALADKRAKVTKEWAIKRAEALCELADLVRKRLPLERYF